MNKSFEEDKTVIAEIDPNDLTPKKSEGDKKASLVQYNGEGAGKRYIIEKAETVIGRSVDCDLSISDSSVSRKHIHVLEDKEEKKVVLEDLGSVNGTYINDIKLAKGHKQSLKDQDLIRIGNIIFKFFSHDNMDGVIQDKIYKLATIDAGTQIYNKQYLLDALENEFSKSKKINLELTVIYFDLDHFKSVNDSYGHNAGDQLLLELTQLVKSHIRKDDIFARFGGEEFIIILPRTDKKTAIDIAERIRHSCEDKIFVLKYEKDGQETTVNHKQTISVGISQFEENMEIAKQLLEKADQKLYISKDTGRNKVTS